MEPPAIPSIPAPASVTLRARYEARETVSLPAFLGGTLHGALGHAVEAVGGAVDDLLGARPPPDDAPRFVRANPPPAAVMLPPPLGRASELSPGATIELGVRLLAADAARIGVALAALERMGARGLGRGRGRLALLEIRDGDGGVVWRDGAVLASPALDRAPLATGSGPWTLRARTPLHLVREGALVTDPRAPDLVAAAARRLVGLAWTYGEPTACDVRALAQAARADLDGGPPGDWARVRGERWSERQRRRHPVEGVVGALPLAATVEPYLRLVAEAVRFGLGKGTALGLGQVELALIA